jgi:hypothetical protein
LSVAGLGPLPINPQVPMTLEAVEQLVDICQGREPCIAPGIHPQVSFLADDIEIERLQAAIRKFVGEPENYGLYFIPKIHPYCVNHTITDITVQYFSEKCRGVGLCELSQISVYVSMWSRQHLTTTKSLSHSVE